MHLWVYSIMCNSNRFFLFSKSWRTSYFGLCNFDLHFTLKVLSLKFCSFHHRPRDDVWMKIPSFLHKTRKVQFVILLSLNDITVTLQELILWELIFAKKVFKIYFLILAKKKNLFPIFCKNEISQVLPVLAFCNPKILGFMGIKFCKFCELTNFQ